ncbi:MAG: hypothetical protein JSS32_04365 [Verrucomicrobia bacterium]|nr:hypothetical protein [Verrucomicrobiota bacterium]
MDASLTTQLHVSLTSVTDLESGSVQTPMSSNQKTLHVATRVLGGVVYGAAVGAVVGGVGGLMTGVGINWFFSYWPWFPINPEFPILVGKVGLCAGVGIKGARACLKAPLDAYEYSLSWRKFLSGLI